MSTSNPSNDLFNAVCEVGALNFGLPSTHPDQPFVVGPSFLPIPAKFKSQIVASKFIALIHCGPAAATKLTDWSYINEQLFNFYMAGSSMRSSSSNHFRIGSQTAWVVALSFANHGIGVGVHHHLLLVVTCTILLRALGLTTLQLPPAPPQNVSTGRANGIPRHDQRLEVLQKAN